MLSRRHLLSALSALTVAPIAACHEIGGGTADGTAGRTTAGGSAARTSKPSDLPTLPPRGPIGSGPLAVRGADLSTVLQEEAAGRVFRDGGRPAPVERLLAARGATVVRLRLWVDPDADGFGLASALSLARRGRDAGLRLLLDLHYSDSWADQEHQVTPAAWVGQNLPTLADTVRAYTRDTVRSFAAQGTPLDMVQIGNEITNGMLWPTGRIYGRPDGENWDAFLTLLKAGIQGAHDGASAPLRTLVHIDRSDDNAAARYFYDHITRAGVRFDIVALSYYPFWHGGLSALKTNLADLAGRYRKDVLVVETAYPWKLPSADLADYHVTRTAQLPDGSRFPATPEGQASYFEAVRAAVAQVPGGRGLGLLAWEPAWLPGVTHNSAAERLYSNLTMFDWNGDAFPSLAVFRSP